MEGLTGFHRTRTDGGNCTCSFIYFFTETGVTLSPLSKRNGLQVTHFGVWWAVDSTSSFGGWGLPSRG